MEYIVWIEDYDEVWRQRPVDNIEAAKRVILDAMTDGKEPILTVKVDFDLKIAVKEPQLGDLTPPKTPGKAAKTEPEKEVKGEATPSETK